MSSPQSLTLLAGIVEAYDFGRFHKIIDIGGGDGQLLSAILHRYPGPRVVVFDLPRVVENTQRTMTADGLAERSEAMAGNFFESVPAGADAYLLKQVLHDWDDAPALAILRNIRQAMPLQGRLLVIESVIPPAKEPSLGKLFDLDMLVTTGCRERTAIEYRDLLAKAGFRLSDIHATASRQSVIEGVPLPAR